MTSRRLLLISNSTLHGGGYLDHAEPEIRSFLGSRIRVLFIPYAMHDRDGYAARTRARLAALGCETVSAHDETADDRRLAALDRAEAIFVGGGNTFRLLDSLQRL